MAPGGNLTRTEEGGRPWHEALRDMEIVRGPVVFSVCFDPIGLLRSPWPCSGVIKTVGWPSGHVARREEKPLQLS